jgi:hypothetical protein
MLGSVDDGERAGREQGTISSPRLQAYVWISDILLPEEKLERDRRGATQLRSRVAS